MEARSKKEINADQELSEKEQIAQAMEELGLGSFEEEMKGASLEEIRNSKMQAVAILSGGIAERILFPKAGIMGNLNYPVQDVKQTPTSYKDKDEHGEITGAKVRYQAAEDLLGMLLNQPYLISTSGQKTAEPKLRTHAKVGAEYIRGLSTTGFAQENQQKVFKIPEEKIILEENSFDTISNLIEIIGIALRHGWQKIGIISNRYHGPRVKAFWSCLQDSQLFEEFLRYKRNKYKARIESIGAQISGNLNEMCAPEMQFFAFARQIKMTFIAAEDILESKGIDMSEVYKRKEYRLREEKEKIGYNALLDRCYR